MHSLRETETRWTLQVSGTSGRKFDQAILRAAAENRFTPCDITFGWTMYMVDGKTVRERMARIIVHNARAVPMLDLWRTIRNSGVGVDCGRVYFQDGTDYCIKRWLASCGLYDGPVPQANDGLKIRQK